MRGHVAILVTVVLLLVACTRQPGVESPAADKGATAAKEARTSQNATIERADEEGIKLSAEEILKLGIETQPAVAAEYTEEVIGYGVIISHDAIAQAAAEVDSAQATAKLSESALARARRLEGTPGAIAADAEEALAQKAVVDESALRLTRQKLSAVYGMNPPWNKPAGAVFLEQVANGNSKLLRATFPLGAMPGQAPRHLRVRHLYAQSAQNDWNVSMLWDAPADSAAPGRSFFALVKAPDAQEGERLQVWAPIGDPVSGVAVPKAAAVMSGGKFWCYVEKPENTFTRVEVDTQRISGDGYFVQQGVEAGDRIVVKAVGQLLAKETGSGEAAD